ncbi:MAG: FHA domain-containing protein [Acidobacteriota bacterium]|nr:FHA domain-containing protein [Acidobacteriota bacterium]
MSAKSLEIRTPSREPRIVAVTQPLVKIGRAPDNHVILEDTECNVSRWHASIRFAEGSPPVLTDLNSANGTLLNGARVTASAPLNPDDAIAIGPHVIVYRDETETPLCSASRPERWSSIACNRRSGFSISPATRRSARPG